MNIVTYIQNYQQLIVLDKIIEKKIEEKKEDINLNLQVILSSKDLSLMSLMNFDELLYLAKECGKRFYISKVLLEIDILMTENVFQKIKKYFSLFKIKDNLFLFNAVRVKDLGVLKLILNEYPSMDVELILDNGPHNLYAIKAFVDLIGSRLKKIILSSQLSKDVLIKYFEFLWPLKISIEILTLGRILLFYTPRKLLSFIDIDANVDVKEKNVTANSEESFHNDFQILENDHGTIMFYPKDLCILSYVNFFFQKQQEVGGQIDFRIDLREQGKFFLLEDILNYFSKGFNNEDLLQTIKNKYGKTLIRGHIEGNKTDLIFKKLKNYNLLMLQSSTDHKYIGKILEIDKGNFIVLLIENRDFTIKIGDRVKIVNPLGKEILFDIKKMESVENGLHLDMAKYNDLVLLQFCKGVSPGSLVYFVFRT